MGDRDRPRLLGALEDSTRHLNDASAPSRPMKRLTSVLDHWKQLDTRCSLPDDLPVTRM